MSTSPTKEASPPKADKKPTFTEKEERVLKAAWSCLKSPPEIDMEKLVIAAEFNTVKTASNTWGVIKKKLKDMNPQPAADGEGGDGISTPTKTKATPKKRGKKAAAADEEEAADDDGESPTKKRKTPKKGKKTKAGADEEVVKTEPAGDDEENVE